MLVNTYLKHELHKTNVGLLDPSKLSLSELMLFIQTQSQKTYSTTLFNNKYQRHAKKLNLILVMGIQRPTYTENTNYILGRLAFILLKLAFEVSF